jgi:hypothetical protein
MRGRTIIARSAISGLAWAAIAILLLLIVDGTVRDAGRLAWQMRGGILAAPLIGIAVGLSSAVPFRHAEGTTRIFISLLSLYTAAFVFNVVAQVAALAASAIQPASLSSVFFDSWNMTVAGLTWTGFVLILGPLAFLNHFWVSRAATLTAT